jgi:mRNA interferase HicA
MTASELKRWLKRQGCTFTEGKKHTLVHFRGEFTEMPRHPSTEIKTGTLQAILKKLGLKK